MTDQQNDPQEKQPDEEEEDDEDYNPNEDPTEEQGDNDDQGAPDTSKAHYLSTIQLQAVDGAFEKLFGYRWGTTFQLDNPKTPQEKLLCRMLGPSATANLLQSQPTTALVTKAKPHRKNQTYKFKKSTTDSSETVPQKKTPAVSSGTKEPPRGVDSLLKQLEGPTKVSTVAKTSADWDQFKEKTGLGEKLEEQAESKAAYLKRQDFLTRVDHRQFELEKKERDQNRVKRN
jgi:hypothetical protein